MLHVVVLAVANVERTSYLRHVGVIRLGLGPRYLGDHLVNVHPHHRIRVDQRLEFGEHGMQRDILAGGKPRLQDVVIVGPPAGAPPHIDTIGNRGHKPNGLSRADRGSNVALAEGEWPYVEHHGCLYVGTEAGKTT